MVFYRKAEEIKSNTQDFEVFISNFQKDCDIVYFIHQARYDQELAAGRVAIACFTHYLPGEHGEKLFEDAAVKCDYCIAVSESTKNDLLKLGTSRSR